MAIDDRIINECQSMPPHGGNLTRAAAEFGLSPRDFLDFSANINPLGLSRRVREAVEDNLWQISHYPDPDCRRLKRALADHLGVDERCLLVGNGAAELIYLLARVVARGRALIPAPTFSEYALAVRAAGGEVAYVFTRPSAGFALPWRDIYRRLGEGDALFLCNPNNPTGTLIPRRELDVLLDMATARRVVVIVDEAFMDFVDDPGEYTLFPLAGRQPNLILVYSLTKILAIPGLRLGALVAPPELVDRLDRLRDPWSVNALAQVAGVAGLQDREYLRQTRAVVSREREFLYRGLSALPGLHPFPGAANFLLVDIGATGYTAAEMVQKMGSKGILLRNCANFPGLGQRYIRLAVRSREENRRLLESLGEIVSK